MTRIVFVSLVVVLLLVQLFGWARALRLPTMRPSRPLWRLHARVYESEVDLKKLVSTSEMVIVVPTSTTVCFFLPIVSPLPSQCFFVVTFRMLPVSPIHYQRANEIAELRKSLPPTCETSIVSAIKMLDAVDSTPHVQLQEMTGTNFVVFVPADDGAVYELFLKWVRQVSKDAEGAKDDGNDASQPPPPPPQYLVCRKGTLLRINR